MLVHYLQNLENRTTVSISVIHWRQLSNVKSFTPTVYHVLQACVVVAAQLLALYSTNIEFSLAYQ